MLEFAEPLALWVLVASLKGSAFILALLALRALLGKRMPPRLLYGMWLLVAVRLLVPWGPDWGYSAFGLPGLNDAVSAVESVFVDEVGATAQVAALDNNQAGLMADEGRAWPILPSFALLWLLGSALFVRRLFRRSQQLENGSWRAVRDGGTIAVLDRCLREMGLKKRVPVLHSQGCNMPAMTGILSPRIIVPRPRDLPMDSEAMRFVFLHELTHMRRGDVAIGLLAELILALHWFNPLVWVAVSKMSADRELACDQSVLERLTPAERRAYGHSLLDVIAHAAGFGHPAAVGMGGPRAELKRRLNAIRYTDRSPLATLPAWLLVALMGAAFLTDAGSFASPHAFAFNNPSKTGLRLPGLNFGGGRADEDQARVEIKAQVMPTGNPCMTLPTPGATARPTPTEITLLPDRHSADAGSRWTPIDGPQASSPQADRKVPKQADNAATSGAPGTVFPSIPQCSSGDCGPQTTASSSSSSSSSGQGANTQDGLASAPRPSFSNAGRSSTSNDDSGSNTTPNPMVDFNDEALDPPSWGKTDYDPAYLYVDMDHPNCTELVAGIPGTPNCSLSAALDFCNPGDTLRVSPGDYSSIEIGIDVSIIGGWAAGSRPWGSGDAATRILSKLSGTPAISLTGGVEATITDIDQISGHHQGIEGHDQTGIRVDPGATLFLASAGVDGGAATGAGNTIGIDCRGTAMITASSIGGGRSEAGSRGIRVLHGVLALRNSLVTGGAATDADVISLDISGASEVEAVNNIIEGGWSKDGDSIAARLDGQVELLSNNTIIGGKSTLGSGTALVLGRKLRTVLINNHVQAGTGSTGSTALLFGPEPGAQAQLYLMHNNFAGATPMPDSIADVDELNACGWQGCAESYGNLSADPLFIDMQAHDYHPDMNSPNIDAGADPGRYDFIISDDLDGHTRPADGDGDGVYDWDIGAYEY